MNEAIWLNFDIETERMFVGPDGIHRITVPERVIALRTMVPTDEEVEAGDTFGSRNKLATQYALEGDVIDTQIDVWGWGAGNTYSQRRGYGYESVPDILQRNKILTPPAEIPVST